MKIICSKNLLFEGLSLVAKAASSRATQPILECCLLVADDGGLSITASDLEMSIKTGPIEAEIVEGGLVALDHKVFMDIVRGLPGSTVEITVDDKNLTVIRSAQSEFKILGMNPEDFPELPEVAKNRGYKIASNELKNMIRQTVFSVATDNSKPVLCGQLLDIRGDNLQMVSVDGFRISLRKWVLDSDVGDEIKIVVPGKTMDEISKILPTDADINIGFYFTDKHILFDLNNCIVVSRLLEGEFINYENMFTTEVTTLVTVARSEILESINRATLISKDSKKNPVKLKIADSRIAISCNTEMGTSYEEFAVMQDGPDLEIAFNPKYLTDVFKVLDAEKVTISFTSSLSPCIIKVEGSEDFKYLVLPLRLRN
ncbi:MAG: DNA polymerase III subunit beta [Clostridiales bacterium]|jgi:DNA polymerase-3 subunit beta|nr:DNA polymerase III subunit beta [Clostridiales bacterium]